MKVKEKIEVLRKLLKAKGIYAYLIDNADHHNSEYVNNYFKERTFMSGFDGSNGILLVTLDEAFLWTDGRYFLQAEIDLKDTGIKLMKMYTPGYPSLYEYVQNNLKDKVIGLDGSVFSSSLVEFFKKTSKVVMDLDLVDEIWKERGLLKTEPIFKLDLKYAGEKSESKLKRIKEEVKKVGATTHVITSIDDIAWILNLRGNDVPITPVFLSFLIIDKKRSTLFVNEKMISKEVREYLESLNVDIISYDKFNEFLKEMKGKEILLSRKQVNALYIKTIEENNNIIDGINPSNLMKAIKNKVEIKNNKETHVYDGLAVFRFMKYLKENYGKIKLDEYSLALKALDFRKMNDRFYKVSFESISSWNENGAIIHYAPTKESSKEVLGSGFFLLDSGGQYMGGTTDITRTFELGEITTTMKEHYTMVLKGLIDVSMSKFIKGTTGQSIDMLARENFWTKGLDYKHGTGHGVGYMLNVHEGPQGIRYQNSIDKSGSNIFLEGMITSIEPGLYLGGEYGIRIENEILCVNRFSNSFGDFLGFDTITVAPIDLDPVIKKLLTKEEKKWLNNYHRFVYQKLSKVCHPSELEYLKYVTRRL